MSNKKRRNREKFEVRLTQSKTRLSFWKTPIIAIAIIGTIVGGSMAYQRQQYVAALLTPAEVIDSRPTNKSDAQLWATLSRQLLSFQANPSIGKKVSAVAANLQNYQEVTDEAFQHAVGLEIDYIAYRHTDFNASEAEVLRSQEKARALLDHLGEDSIGIEGSECDPRITMLAKLWGHRPMTLAEAIALLNQREEQKHVDLSGRVPFLHWDGSSWRKYDSRDDDWGSGSHRFLGVASGR